MFERIGAFVYDQARGVLLASALFLLVAIAVVARGASLTETSIEGLEADAAQVLVDRIVGRSEDLTLAVTFRSDSADPSDAAFGNAMHAALEPVRGDPNVAAVLTPAEAPRILQDRYRNSASHAALALVTLKGPTKAALAAYPSVRAKLASSELAITCTGHIAYVHDLAVTLERDLVRAELLSLPIALVILFLVFRTPFASALPVGIGGLSVLGGIAIIFGLSRVIDVAQYTINVCSLIGLGVAIDYSLFIVSRYRQELASGLAARPAVIRSVATAGRAVAFSGVAVFCGLAGLLVFRGSYLAVMGVGGAIVVALSVLFALTMLPAALALSGPRLHRADRTLSLRPRSGIFLHRLATAVMRRPWLTLVPTVGILVTLALPALRMRLAATDVRVLPADCDARRGYDALGALFPTLAQTRIAIAIRFPSEPVLTRQRIGDLYDFSRHVARLPHVLRVESLVDADPEQTDEIPSKEDFIELYANPPEDALEFVDEAKKLAVSGSTTLVYAITTSPPDSFEAQSIVRTLRANPHVGDGTFLVGGQAAHDTDTTSFLVSRAPYAALVVVGATLLVVFAALRSVLLPLKAVLMNALSLAAAFGVMVWIFQDGHLWVAHGHPLEPTLPVLLFCVAFGMSMDYEVLMLVRMKEIYERTGDNRIAVAEGLEHTAGLVTSAAAIMVAVFAAFAIARVAVVQATGIGLGVAVALDATLVRALLVPATMRLLGHLNWWCPGSDRR